MAKMAFLKVNNYFCAFSKYRQKNICASIVFKAESRPKHEDNYFWGGFLQKPKMHFFGGPKWYLQYINIWAPCNFLKIEILTCVRQGACKNLELDFQNDKIILDLWLLDLFCPIKKNVHTPP